jgi:anaerobic selenocysteine-containing dehydrogenase
MQMETPAMTAGSELIKYYTSGTGIPAPYAQYTPRLIDPPEGSDLTEEWQFFLGLAKRMGLELWFINFFGSGGGRFMESAPIVEQFNGDSELTTEVLFEKMCATSRIPLDEVRSHPHGNIFDVDAVVEERDIDCTARLDVGNAVLLSGLARILSEDFEAAQIDTEFPMRLIPRRHPNFMNSSGITLSALNRGKPYNPAYLHPDTLASLGMESGTSALVASRHDQIPCVLEADDSMRRDVISMHHAFGGFPAVDRDYRDHGSNVGRLVPTDAEYDPITGMPRQANIAVRILPDG